MNEQRVTELVRELISELGEDPGREGLQRTPERVAAGYKLLGEGKVDQAIAVFQLAAAEHPESYNVYDSLGEAYMVGGQVDAAIENYAKSLELNPDNANAAEKLKELRATRGQAGPSPGAR